MVKVKEFCCGCSLRTGTLILAWSVLTLSCLILTTNLAEFLKQKNKTNPSEILPVILTFIFRMLESIFGIAVSVVAIWALQKKKANYLNGLFWYFCYRTIKFILSGLLLIFDPAWEQKIGENEIQGGNGLLSTDYKILFSVILVLLAAFTSYFALVVKSSRDYALRNEAQNNSEIPDPTVVGYVNKI